MKKSVRLGMIILTMLSLLIGVRVGVSRSQIEQGRTKFQVAIKYTDVLDMSNQTNKSFEEVLVELKETGVTTLLVNENKVIPDSSTDLANYKQQGRATYYEGYQLRVFYPNVNDIQLKFFYIETLDKKAEDAIFNHFTEKGIVINRIQIEDKSFLEFAGPLSLLSTVGVGFNQEDLNLAAQLGYTISPQLKSWTGASEESITYVIKQLREISSLGAIYFSDAEVVGFDSATMQELVSEKGLGFIEFYSDKQKGFVTLAKESRRNEQQYTVTRLHTLTDGEVNNYKKQELIQRYMLALRERNINTFLFKLPNRGNINTSKEELLDNITSFIQEANKKNYTTGNEAITYNLELLNYWSVLLVGMAAICIFILLCQEMGLKRIGMIVGVLGFIGYAIILKWNLIEGSKYMALFAAICFPTYAMIKGLNTKSGSISHAIKALLITTGISFGGAVIVVGTISSTGFGLGVELFRGVKIAFLMPIVGVLLVAIYKYHNLNIKKVEKWIKNPITYGTMILLGILVIVMFVYISKSGNSGQVYSFEIKLRQFLNNTLGVRPRTKEFLIGYPILMLMIYYGYKEFYWPLLVLATMGQISLINTFTHIHTPLMISMIRSGYGVAIGVILGIILIYIFRWGISLLPSEIQNHPLLLNKSRESELK